MPLNKYNLFFSLFNTFKKYKNISDIFCALYPVWVISSSVLLAISLRFIRRADDPSWIQRQKKEPYKYYETSSSGGNIHPTSHRTSHHSTPVLTLFPEQHSSSCFIRHLWYLKTHLLDYSLDYWVHKIPFRATALSFICKEIMLRKGAGFRYREFCSGAQTLRKNCLSFWIGKKDQLVILPNTLKML